MQTLVLQQPGTFVWQETSRPVPQAHEALVRVRRCGICGTDLHAYAGKQPFFSYPRRLGHELCVEVVTAPAGATVRPGDLCAVEAYDFCGHCPACRAGKTNCCKSLKVLGVHVDGGHAPFLALPVAKLHPGPGLTPEQLALVEPLVIGAHSVERAQPSQGEPTLILGMGPIGLAAAVFARAAGAQVALVDMQAARLAFASERMALGTPFLAGPDLGARLQTHFGQLPSVIIDATGSPASMKGTFLLAEHGARIVFVGLFPGEVSFDDPNFHRRELTLMASRAGLSGTFREVIRLLQSGTIEVLPLITHRFAFSDTARLLPTLQQEPHVVKAMIDFDAAA